MQVIYTYQSKISVCTFLLICYLFSSIYSRLTHKGYIFIHSSHGVDSCAYLADILYELGCDQPMVDHHLSPKSPDPVSYDGYLELLFKVYFCVYINKYYSYLGLGGLESKQGCLIKCTKYCQHIVLQGVAIKG